MLAADIVKDICLETGLNRREGAKVYQEIIKSIKNGVCNGDKVVIQGLGTIKPKYRHKRRAYDMTNNVDVEIPAQYKPVFVFSTELIESVKKLPIK